MIRPFKIKAVVAALLLLLAQSQAAFAASWIFVVADTRFDYYFVETSTAQKTGPSRYVAWVKETYDKRDGESRFKLPDYSDATVSIFFSQSLVEIDNAAGLKVRDLTNPQLFCADGMQFMPSYKVSGEWRRFDLGGVVGAKDWVFQNPDSVWYPILSTVKKAAKKAGS